MKLAEAQEILTDEAQYLTEPHHQDYKDATKLGIEAMNHILSARKHFPLEDQPLLPGETPNDQR